MKKKLLSTFITAASCLGIHAQVTQINNNNSLEVVVALTSTKAIVVSSIDSSIWTTDASLAGTVKIATPVKYEGYGSVLSGKFIFRGSTPATGSEIYITDGTSAGTVLVSDIYPGPTSSAPSDFTLLNGFVYFSARTAAEGRELWKTNGTSAGTGILKDIVAGPDSSNVENGYHLYSSGTYLLFAANTAASGVELWRSDGTTAGTALLKDINTGNSGVDSSNPSAFYPLNNKALFTATDATHGTEIYITDGTLAGTIMLADINPGPASSTDIEIFPGFTIPYFTGFHIFNNHAYFQANDGTSSGELWSTDGTPANTVLLKDIVPGTGFSFVFAIDAVNLPGKFIFPVSDGDAGSRSELWQSDGTPGGTTLFKSFTPVESGDVPVNFIPYNADIFNGNFTNPLFQGNLFFFAARTPTQGYELWKSDGTVGGTSVVKDINSGPNDGVSLDQNLSYLYTTTALFFAANDGTHGNELWKTDGTEAGTTIVQDINPNAGDADPDLNFLFNNKILFTATDGDDPNNRDLFVVDGNFSPLPLKLQDFTVKLQAKDGILNWNTLQEINVKNFSVQRSFDGQHFETIGTVSASGTSYNSHAYTFTDVAVANSGKEIVYYRLSLNDIDGKAAYTNIISLKLRGKAQWNVSILSNPVQANVNLLLTDITGNLQLTIRDISGKIIFTKTMNNINGQVSLPAPAQKGMYILESENNNERKSLKFIK